MSLPIVAIIPTKVIADMIMVKPVAGLIIALSQALDINKKWRFFGLYTYF
ncbi:MAG TPA: hypothetical protein VH796_04240 [Nitrososphaeraceae archaeon]|jgi:hypothetical protein